MTREEQTDWLCRLRAYLNNGVIFTPLNKEFTEALTGILEQSPKMEQFAKWVATEIFDDMWEYNKDSFAEIACRKLAKLGIVRAKGDEWELVEPQESEVEHGKMNLDEYGNLEEPCLSCDKAYMDILSYEWCCDEKECPYTPEKKSENTQSIELEKDDK